MANKGKQDNQLKLREHRQSNDLMTAIYRCMCNNITHSFILLEDIYRCQMPNAKWPSLKKQNRAARNFISSKKSEMKILP